MIKTFSEFKKLFKFKPHPDETNLVDSFMHHAWDSAVKATEERVLDKVIEYIKEEQYYDDYGFKVVYSDDMLEELRKKYGVK